MRELSVKLHIVIPVLDDAEALAKCLLALRDMQQQAATVVVADGGSTDHTWALASAHADQVIWSARGRAVQMNAGAAALAGQLIHDGVDPTDTCRDVLLFLHADTVLPSCALERISQAMDEGFLWGRFDVGFETPGDLKWLAGMMNRRSAWTGIATGDQAIFVRRDVFERIGGFANQALMEDIELSTRLKRLGPPARVREPVITSARRWKQHGVWTTILLMWRLRLAYFFGADPHKLALQYGYRPAAMPANACLAVLAKAPIAGLAKTRLAPLLGSQVAARFQRRLTLDTLFTAQQARLQQIDLWCTPNTEHRFFRSLRKAHQIRCEAQPEGDLGARMRFVFSEHFSRREQMPLLIVGTDCAVLAPAHLQQAGLGLLTHDVVLIPAQDGGYVLIGMRRYIPEVFEGVAWSTSQVLAQTRERLKTVGASWLELPELWDIDEPADWQRWNNLLDLQGIAKLATPENRT